MYYVFEENGSGVSLISVEYNLMFDILFVFKRCLTGQSKKQKFICTKTKPTKLEKFRRCQYYVVFYLDFDRKLKINVKIKKQTYFVFLISYKLLDYFLQSSQIWLLSFQNVHFFFTKTSWLVASDQSNPKKLQRLNHFRPLYLSKGSHLVYCQVFQEPLLALCDSVLISSLVSLKVFRVSPVPLA